MASEAQPERWEGFPPADMAKAWEKAYPGSAEKMFVEAIRSVRDQRRLAWAQVCVEGLSTLFAGGTVVLFVWLARYFVDHGAPVEGAVVVGAGLAALVGVFLGRRAATTRGSGKAGFHDVASSGETSTASGA